MCSLHLPSLSLGLVLHLDHLNQERPREISRGAASPGDSLSTARTAAALRCHPVVAHDIPSSFRKFASMSRHLLALTVAALTLAGCVVAPAPRVYVAPPAAVVYLPLPPPLVVSVYIEPPVYQPPPVVIGWAPPPMLVEPPPPQPFLGAFWVGGYWAWQGNWVWSAGRWAPPPQPGYGWVQPYYEHRESAVIFIGGHWAAPGVVFAPPPPTLSLTLAVSLPGVVPGPRPIGPPGIFVPPPPGSRVGLIVPAPIGTAPAVVVGAPPVTNVGMRIQNRVDNTTINNTRISNVTNITNVTIVAPAAAMASGKAFEAQVPAQAHLAAAQAPVVHTSAPIPESTKPIAAFAPARPLPVLPAAQPVRARPATAAEATADAQKRQEAAQRALPAAVATPPVVKPAELERVAPVPGRPPTSTAAVPAAAVLNAQRRVPDGNPPPANKTVRAGDKDKGRGTPLPKAGDEGGQRDAPNAKPPTGKPVKPAPERNEGERKSHEAK